MKPFKGITITPFSPVDAKDPKGPTYEWCKGLPGLQVTICKRHKGIMYGNHFHTGKDPSKNPERFFIISGKTKLKARNKQNQTFECIISENTEVLIEPYIFHTFEALTDVVFIEYRSTVYDRKHPDAYSEEEFEN